MTTLLTITHDPDGAQLPFFDTSLFDGLFEDAVMVASPLTHPDIIHKFNKIGHAETMPLQGMGQARRDVLALACEAKVEGERFFYCDFDRLLFWLHHDAYELQNVLDDNYSYGFTVFGRTPKAFASHPELQRQTERAMNMIVNCWLRLGVECDFFAGARLFDAALADVMLASHSHNAAIDVEWPVLVASSGLLGRLINYCAVDGLGYESEFFGIERLLPGEVALRARNLASVMDFVKGRQ